MSNAFLEESNMAALANKRRKHRSHKLAYQSDEDRWNAVLNREPDADGAFVYAVATTGVYCRPTCAARLALRRNVRFFVTCDEAEAAGYRPCKRCKPTEAKQSLRHAELISRACRMIEKSEGTPNLKQLSGAVGMSPFHFHRIFKAQTGVTPKAYASAQLRHRIQNGLSAKIPVTQALYGAGFNSSSQFYESAIEMLGMKPKVFRDGGCSEEIRFSVRDCWLGSILVAATSKGICAILLGEDPNNLAKDLHDRFPKAQLIRGDSNFERLVARVIRFLDSPTCGLNLPLDIRGTVFQQQVWQALQKIPLGSTATYTDIAKRIGRPKSSRAVAAACASNAHALAIPCHRVVRLDGSLAGYRWGVERKKKLLARESNAE
jgi:AraC family transcriptional regulator of adaptative response/methylated-DNA-[protein]-cysteine methyltransferase